MISESPAFREESETLRPEIDFFVVTNPSLPESFVNSWADSRGNQLKGSRSESTFFETLR